MLLYFQRNRRACVNFSKVTADVHWREMNDSCVQCPPITISGISSFIQQNNITPMRTHRDLAYNHNRIA